jgi:hypothetical protein
MLSHPEIASRFGFRVYETDLQTGELWKAGQQPMNPLRVLVQLMTRFGEQHLISP